MNGHERPDADCAPPPALEPAHHALLDAHESWHEAFESYHQPTTFRRRLEALIQGLRNVTWRLQASKHELSEFDTWYSKWQDFFRADPRMRWLNDARIAVTKKAGLHSASRAIVRIIHSYFEPPVKVFEVPATTSTARILERVQQSLPDVAKPHAVIQIARRWEVPNLPGQELLGLLRDCWHALDALLIFASDVASGSTPDEPPDQFLQQVAYPSCMLVDPSRLPLMFEADTGDALSLPHFRLTLDEEVKAQVAERYKFKKLNPAADLEEVGREAHALACKVFKKDGYHLPITRLRRPDGSWEIHQFLPEDKRAKFVYWHALANYVAARGHDAVIHTGEVWEIPPTSIPHEPYPLLEGLPGSEEALTTWLTTADGKQVIWSSRIVRHLGKGFLKKAITNDITSQHHVGLFMPLRRVWGVADSESDPEAAQP